MWRTKYFLLGGVLSPGDRLGHTARQISEVDDQFLEARYDDYNATNASAAAFCRSTVLILMALLLIPHASSIPDSDGDADEDASTFLTLFLLRIAGFLLPCYIMVWAISILQRRRQELKQLGYEV